MISIPYKFSKKRFKTGIPGFAVGVIAALTLCGFLFGEDIYKYYEFKHICETETIDKIYDQEAYEKYLKNSNSNKTIKLQGEELSTFMKKFRIENYDPTRSVYYDKENNYLYYIVQQSENNKGFFEYVTVNLNTNTLIDKYKNYWGYGGWFTKFMNGSSGSSSFGSCKENKLGAFKNK
jgi:hypothetical protein